MTTPRKLPSRLHHTAYTTKDMEQTRVFYEEVIGLPLVATWSESDELFGQVRTYCHCFFGLADGGALAFFQFADPRDEQTFSPPSRRRPFITSRSRSITRHRRRSQGVSRRRAIRHRTPLCWSTATAARCISETLTGCSSNSRAMPRTPRGSPRSARRTPCRPCGGGWGATTPRTTCIGRGRWGREQCGEPGRPQHGCEAPDTGTQREAAGAAQGPMHRERGVYLRVPT